MLGVRNDLLWARASIRRYARAWGAFANAIHDDVSRVVWILSQCSRGGTGARALDDGSPVTDELSAGNDVADRLITKAADEYSVPTEQRHSVLQLGLRISFTIEWLGRVIAFVNALPLPVSAGRKGRDAVSALRTAGARNEYKKRDFLPRLPPSLAWIVGRRRIWRPCCRGSSSASSAPPRRRWRCLPLLEPLLHERILSFADSLGLPAACGQRLESADKQN